MRKTVIEIITLLIIFSVSCLGFAIYNYINEAHNLASYWGGCSIAFLIAALSLVVFKL